MSAIPGDVPFDLDWPEPLSKTPPPRPRGRTPDAQRTGVTWRRFSSTSRVHCEDCIARIRLEGEGFPRQAVWRRTDHDQGTSRLICHDHRATYPEVRKKGRRP